MPDEFLITVKQGKEEISFPARLLQFGYSYKIEVDVNGAQVIFEPDEERNWRAQLQPEQWQLRDKIKPGLLVSIAGEIENILK